MSSTRRYRILHVFNRYLFMGGEEKSVDRTHELLGRNHDLEWLFFESSDWVGKAAPSKLEQLWRIFYNPASKARFERAVAEFKPDVALFHNIYPVGSPSLYHAAGLLGVPVIQMTHNFRPFSVGGTLCVKGQFTSEALHGNYWREIWLGAWRNSRVSSAVMALVLKMLHRSGWLRSVKKWLCISEFMRGKFIEAGVPEERAVTLRHSWDAMAELPVITDGGYYLFLGRLVEVKGIDVLLRAWRMLEAKLGDATPELRIAGEGALESMVREAAKGSEHVKYLGLISGTEKANAIANCRAMLAPSTWWEPLGLVTYEAYDYAKPMLAAASGGLSETVIDGETGFLHESGAAGELARDVQAMEMMTAAERAAMGARGRQWLLENASTADWMARFELMIERAIAMQQRDAVS